MAFITNTKDEDATTEDIVDTILTSAILNRASDVHIEPHKTSGAQFYFRIDSSLVKQSIEQVIDLEKLIIRIKVMCGLDITMREIPQEGHFVFYFQHGVKKQRTIDVRVSIFPTIYGEVIVMRLLNREESLINLKKIGFAPDIYKKIEQHIRQSYGIFLVTGPVNSGKTTTLYSILQEIHTEEKNIMTLEDPVEYHMPGIRQSQISPARGFEFSTGLRAILRQDPDVIMVGEIRDPDTAEIAIRASLTGRLVLSTLHTNSTIATIARLIDMGVPRWLVSSSVNGVVTQRLVRQICEKCKVQYVPSAETLHVLNLETSPSDVFYKGQGCEECRNTGFKGRMGIFEVLELDDELRNLILENAPLSAVRAKAIEKGMHELIEDGISKAKQGTTTLEEIIRVAV